MIRIRNKNIFNDYLQKQNEKYPQCGVIQTVIIDKLTEYEYYVVGLHDYSDALYYVMINPKCLLKSQQPDKVTWVLQDMFICDNYYIDNQNIYIGKYYEEKLKDFKRYIEGRNKSEYEL